MKADGNLKPRNLYAAGKHFLMTTLPSYLKPPLTLLRSLGKKIMRTAAGGIEPEAQLAELLKLLHGEAYSERFKHVRKLELHESSSSSSSSSSGVTYASVAWVDEEQLPAADDLSALTVITSDVTHGLIDPMTGFDKFDSYCIRR